MDKKTKELLYVWMILLFVGSFYVIRDPSITGMAVYSTSTNYTDIIGQSYNITSKFNWTPIYDGKITSLRLSGSYEDKGVIIVYLDDGLNRYKIIDTTIEESGLGSITGFTILDEESQTVVTDNNYFLYNPGTIYDPEDDGIEKLSGVIDFTVNNSLVEYQDNNTCTIYGVLSKETDEETYICYGSLDCCNVNGLMPTIQSWDEAFYLYYGQYGATENNIISAQVFYENDTSYASLEREELSAKFMEQEIALFEEMCIESCLLPQLNSSSYTLIIEVDNSSITIDDISYTVFEEIEEVIDEPVEDIILENVPPSLLQNFSDIVIKINNNYSIDLSKYFFDEDPLAFDYYQVDNITVKIDANIAKIIPQFNYTGERFMFFKANDSLASTVSNVFMINVTDQNISLDIEPEETTKAARIVINKPVKWIKTIKLDAPQKDLKIELIKDAKNISIKKIENGTKKEIDIENIQVNKTEDKDKLKKNEEKKGLSMITGSFIGITGRAVQEEEVSNKTVNSTELIITEIVEEVEVEYYTEGPSSEEEIITDFKKKIVISSDIHYENILAYTYLENQAPSSAVTLYWITDLGRQTVDVTKSDTDGNGLIDYLEWTVPHLSNQTYEVEINILNVQSYPMVGGTWTVQFTTTGTANLTITGYDGTIFGNDIEFNEIRCGEEVIDVLYDGTTVFVQDWNCSSIGYHEVSVITPGAHTQEFDFGGQKAYAKNIATTIPKTLNLQGKLTNSTGGLINETVNFTFSIYNAYTGGTKLWEENQTVFVEEGIYSVILGNTIDLNLSFSTQTFLGVSANEDAEMVPRLNLTSSPTTIRAITAENVSCTDCLDTVQIRDVYALNTGDTITGDFKVESTFNASTAEGQLYVDSDGNVKIGI